MITPTISAAAGPDFFDAATWRNLEGVSSAALYADGEFAVSSGDQASLKLARIRHITVTGNGRIASIIDGRPDNPLSPAQVRGFVRERRSVSQHAIIYTPRSWAAEYLAILADDGHGKLGEYEHLQWWISTLDNVSWTAAGLAAELANNWDAPIPQDRIWACQNVPGALRDGSVLYQPW